MARDYPVWTWLLLRVAARRATDAEIGDLLEEYVAGRHSAFWLTNQVVSTLRRRRSPLTIPERGAEMFTNVRNDVQYALRTLRRQPGFAVAAIMPIALGIGINTVVFSILNSVAWRPLPVPGADALVSVYQDFRGGPRRTVHGARSLFSIPEYRAYRDQAHTLSGLMAYSRQWTVTLGRESPQEIEGILVTCNYFDVLGLSPAIGPGFTPANCGTPDASPVVVLSHALWTSVFAADPLILQRPIVLNGVAVTVAGIAPAGFDGVDMARAAFFAPASIAHVFRSDPNLHENPHVSWMTLIGRRRSGTELAEVRADLALIARRIDQQQPGRTTSVIVERAAALSLPVARDNVLRGAALVMVAFGLVLLIASSNVANILLARAAARTREIAIRVSVGATRGRILRQLLTESAIIALAGAVSGSLLFAWLFQALIPWLLASVPGAEPLRIDATPDRTVLWFALGLTGMTALVFGLVPALQASGADIHPLTKQDTAGGRRGWIRGTLVGAQIALCTMLLIPAGLLTRALQAAHRFDPGFDHRNVAVATIDLRGPRYEKGGAAAFHGEWVERIRALPGVESISHASRIPLSAGRSQTTIHVGDEAEARVVDVNTVSPEFFSVLDIPIVRGRTFTEAEPDAAIVTESTARHYWPGLEAIGQAVTMDGVRRHIVGVAGDAQLSQARDAIASYVFLPAVPGTQQRISVLARTDFDTSAFAAVVRAATSRMDAGLVVNVQPLSNNLAMLQILAQITASVAGLLSMLALALAAIGVYGVVAYVVSQRRHEVGVRIALGAGARDVQRLILRQTLGPVAAGMSIGFLAATVTVRLLQSILFGVSPYDPVVFMSAALFMLAVATVAALVPTRRAMRVNPLSVLRSE